MATTTVGAIVERFDASGAAVLSTGSGSQLWVGEVPEQYSVANGPFAALRPGRSTPEWNFRQSYLDREDMTFVFLAERLATAETVAKAAMAAFDPKTLSLDAGPTTTFKQAYRTAYRVVGVEPWRDANGELVHRVEVDYSFLWQKSY